MALSDMQPRNCNQQKAPFPLPQAGQPAEGKHSLECESVRTQGAKIGPCEFVNILFSPDDILEVRAIESWRGRGRKQSRLVERSWLRPHELASEYERLLTLNERENANIYFGCNPRSERGSNEVTMVRCLWADIDHASPESILPTLPPVLPFPSMAVRSGRGTHLYWLLSEPQDVSTTERRGHLEEMLRNVHTAIGGDCVSDATRLLRLPGFQNCKDARNGAAKSACEVAHFGGSVYPISAFEPWMHKGEAGQTTAPNEFWSFDGPPDERTRRRIEGLVRHLDAEVVDRSRRDFSVACGLIRLGVCPEAIKLLLKDKSKFAGNPQYLHRTIENAIKAVCRE